MKKASSLDYNCWISARFLGSPFVNWNFTTAPLCLPWRLSASDKSVIGTLNQISPPPAFHRYQLQRAIAFHPSRTPLDRPFCSEPARLRVLWILDGSWMPDDPIMRPLKIHVCLVEKTPRHRACTSPESIVFANSVVCVLAQFSPCPPPLSLGWEKIKIGIYEMHLWRDASVIIKFEGERRKKKKKKRKSSFPDFTERRSIAIVTVT